MRKQLICVNKQLTNVNKNPLSKIPFKKLKCKHFIPIFKTFFFVFEMQNCKQKMKRKDCSEKNKLKIIKKYYNEPKLKTVFKKLKYEKKSCNIFSPPPKFFP